MNDESPEAPKRPARSVAYPFQQTDLDRSIASRSAGRHAAYLLPYLRPGMDVLDCGCGPGSITLGLAQAVAPGTVVGVDIQPGQVTAAQTLATKSGVTNVRFEVASACHLPFADGTFDAVHSNATVMYIPDALGVLREMRRVLKPSGILGVRDIWNGQAPFAPVTPLMAEFWTLHIQAARHLGFRLDYPPRQRQLLLEAGLVDVQASADAEVFASAEGLNWIAGTWLSAIAPGSALARAAIELGWADEAKWEEIRAEWRSWAQRPDAFYCWLWCSAVGRADARRYP